ncbi:IS630 family transposase, partial [Deinococcus multiflagellatus]
MARQPRPPHIVLSPEEQQRLTELARRRKTLRGLAARAQLILLSAEQPYTSLTQIGEQLGVCRHTVRTWRQRFVQDRIAGLRDAPKPGAPRKIQDDDVERLIRLTLDSVPANATHWTTRSMAQASGMTQNAVFRIWRAFGLRPHLSESFKLSQDPLFIEKVRDIVGLYLSPPAKALVLCVDEKPQIQALERNGGVFPMQPGEIEKRAHDYVRHGTTTLFAALNAQVGTVIGKCYPRHRSEEFKAFLEEVNQNVPADLDVHLILDNYVTHKAKVVQDWLVG